LQRLANTSADFKHLPLHERVVLTVVCFWNSVRCETFSFWNKPHIDGSVSQSKSCCLHSSGMNGVWAETFKVVHSMFHELLSRLY